MRELSSDELDSVSGGYTGTPIPYANWYIPGPNWPGGAAGAWAALPVAYATGSTIGTVIYEGTEYLFDMSIGEAAYITLNS